MNSSYLISKCERLPKHLSMRTFFLAQIVTTHSPKIMKFLRKPFARKESFKETNNALGRRSLSVPSKGNESYSYKRKKKKYRSSY